MKIAIISDIHDNLANLEKFLTWASNNQIEELIVCGDICMPDTLTKVLALIFKSRIHVVFGNVCDREAEQEAIKEFPNIVHYGDEGNFLIDSKRVGLTHYPQRAKEMAATKKFDVIFYGHSHQPWIENIAEAEVVNPGTLGGLFSKATFAMWDTNQNKLELKEL